ncbi:MAG: vWA domain-containing protein [Planctomycetota bacterium]
MKTTIVIICLSAILAGFCPAVTTHGQTTVQHKAAPDEMPTVQEKPLIQMAILLDTSGSMSGLIDQARAELWAIVNEFIFAKRNGLQPELQVALYEYGKNSVPRESGYIRMIVPLTTDLDKISQELFALKTDGGQEYCGWVIKEAAENLQWTGSPEDLKVIFIAGNERFTQGPVDYRQACKAAASKGVVVNTIHCGSEIEGANGKWKDGALLADGRYLNINHNQKTVHIAAPQDKQITELGVRLNDTYIGFGRMGRANAERQFTQEEAAVQRAVTKSSRYYQNDNWDLVDALNNNTIQLENLKPEDLPEEMKDMTTEQREAYVQSRQKERAEIQKKIQKLNAQRSKYVADEMKKLQGGQNTLGSAVIQAVRDQAIKRNFEFQQREEPPKNTGQTD